MILWKKTEAMLSAVNPTMRAASGAQPGAPEDGETRACYGIVVACVSLLLLCALVSAVGVAKAFAATGVVILLFGLIGLLAPTGAFLPLQPPGSATEAPARAPAVRLVRRCSCGLAGAALSALPTFAYEPQPRGAGDAGKPRGSCVLCAVCLEDVQAGEMVRQLPACSHLFHAGCIDVWLRSHRTCPLCRCELPPRKDAAKSAPPATVSSADALPPV